MGGGQLAGEEDLDPYARTRRHCWSVFVNTAAGYPQTDTACHVTSVPDEETPLELHTSIYNYQISGCHGSSF